MRFSWQDRRDARRAWVERAIEAAEGARPPRLENAKPKDLAAVAGNLATVAGINIEKALFTGGRPKSNAQTQERTFNLRVELASRGPGTR